MVSLHVRTGGVGPLDLVGLPWQVPLDEWPEEESIRLPRGTHRHPLRFIERSGRYLALKELPDRLVQREYDLLAFLSEEGLPAVEPVGTALRRSDDAGQPLDGVLVTAHLSYSLPYRTLFAGPAVPDLRERLLDALAVLLARLHLVGFFWGDCSLNNALFRRDAGALVASVVDVETGERHERLTDGQRGFELDIATENIAGGLFDLMAAGRLDEPDLDPFEVAADLRHRYDGLWSELTREDVVDIDELWRIQERLRRLNELGFDTAEVEMSHVGGPSLLRFRPRVVEEGHHRRELRQLTGIDAQENQARRLLNAIRGYGAWLAAKRDREVPDAEAAYRWMTERYEPTLAAIPTELRERLEDAELFHQVLEHNWFLSEQAGVDVGLERAVDAYIEDVLAHARDERTVIGADTAELALGEAADGTRPTG